MQNLCNCWNDTKIPLVNLPAAMKSVTSKSFNERSGMLGHVYPNNIKTFVQI